MTIEKIEIISIHTNGFSKKRLHLKCDWCDMLFSKEKNVSRLLKNNIHFCCNKCAGKYKYKNMPQVRTEQNLLKSLERQKNDKTYAKEIKRKKEKTCLERYGAATPLESKKIQEQCKKTLINKYKVDNPQKSKQIQDKTKQTCLERYGNEYQITSKQTRKKIKKALLEKYNTVSPAPIKYYIKETNESIVNWLKKQKNPKPRRDQVYRTFNKTIIPLKDLEQFLEDWRNKKTSLEMIAEQLFDCKHYNKKPKQISKTYKPDFKLSDIVYVNVDGLYWHSSAIQKDKYYHFNMRKHFEECGLQLIQFRENEITNKPLICHSIVSAALEKPENKLYDGECVIKNVDFKEARRFICHNSLNESIGNKHVGLYYSKQLVSLLSYTITKNKCNIVNFCSVPNFNIEISFSALVNNLEKTIKDNVKEMHLYIDLRYGHRFKTNKILSAEGFVFEEDVLMYDWTDFKKVCNFDIRLSDTNYFKIHDAGQRKYVKYL